MGKNTLNERETGLQIVKEINVVNEIKKDGDAFVEKTQGGVGTMSIGELLEALSDAHNLIGRISTFSKISLGQHINNSASVSILKVTAENIKVMAKRIDSAIKIKATD